MKTHPIFQTSVSGSFLFQDSQSSTHYIIAQFPQVFTSFEKSNILEFTACANSVYHLMHCLCLAVFLQIRLFLKQEIYCIAAIVSPMFLAVVQWMLKAMFILQTYR